MPADRAIAAAPIVVPFDRETVPGELAGLLPDAVRERWTGVDRTAHAPRLVAVPGDDGWSAAALVSARPGTAYLKIVDAVGDVPAAVDAVLDTAAREGLVQVKWEGWTATAEQAAALGFLALRTPATPGEKAGSLDAGYVRWLTDAAAVSEPRYYRQSTDFSCGAVAALLAQVQVGAVPAEDMDREAELTLWRSATNFNACEPVGLGVAVRRAWPQSPVVIALDVDRPVILDFYPEADQEWRAVLQRASRTEAAELGVPIERDRLSISGVRDALSAGDQVLLVISLQRMQGVGVPHWVLCHGAVSGALVIEDPFVFHTAGETWVDAHLLPVPDDELDEMSSLEADRFRGAVRIGASVAA